MDFPYLSWREMAASGLSSGQNQVLKNVLGCAELGRRKLKEDSLVWFISNQCWPGARTGPWPPQVKYIFMLDRRTYHQHRTLFVY